MRAGRTGQEAPRGRHSTMLKRCGRRLLLALAGALLACLLVLTADPPPPPVPSEHGRRALRSLAGPAGAAPAPGQEAAASPGALAREVHSLSEYLRLLTRARRDAGPPPGGASRPADGRSPQPAEPLAPRDVFIAVKTTKKFHRARLDLLLETWISRHKEMVSHGAWARGRGKGAPSCPAGGGSHGRQGAPMATGLFGGCDTSPFPCSPVCLVVPLPSYSGGGVFWGFDPSRLPEPWVVRTDSPVATSA